MILSALRKQPKLLFVGAVLLASCNKDLNLDNWEPQMLMPLVKASASVKDVADLRDKAFVQTLPSLVIGYPAGIPVNVPQSEIGVIGPYGYTLSEYFSSVEVDSAVFEFGLNNTFPIPVSKGTKIVFRSSNDAYSTTNIIYEHEIANDIPAFGSYSSTEVVLNKTVPSRIYLFIQSFKTEGASHIQFSDNPMQLSFDIKFLKVFRAAINTDKEYGITDTTSMELVSSISNYSDSTANGKLNVFLNSSMPVNFSYQMYFLDETKTVLIDSLYYGDMYSPGCNVNASGEPVSSLEKKFEIILTPDRIRKLRDAKYMAYRLSGDTHGYTSPVVYIDGNCSLKLQITGDVKLKVGALLPG